MATTTPTSDLSTALGDDPQVTRLYDNVQAEVPAIGLSAIKLAAWNTIEDFYIQSTTRREHTYWRMPAGVTAIDFNPYDENWVVAWILDYCGLPANMGKVEHPSILRDLTYPTPASERDGEALLALKPASFDAVNAGGVPDLWSTWFQAILDGTLMRLYGQPAKPYSSPQLAQFHGRKYSAGVVSARGIAIRSYTNGPRWQYPYFAAGRRKS